MSSAQEIVKAGEEKAHQGLDSAKGMTSSAAQSAQAGKDQAGGFMQQTTEQVKSMAANAADTVKSTLGMGGNSGSNPGS